MTQSTHCHTCKCELAEDEISYNGLDGRDNFEYCAVCAQEAEQGFLEWCEVLELQEELDQRQDTPQWSDYFDNDRECH